MRNSQWRCESVSIVGNAVRRRIYTGTYTQHTVTQSMNTFLNELTASVFECCGKILKCGCFEDEKITRNEISSINSQQISVFFFFSCWNTFFFFFILSSFKNVNSPHFRIMSKKKKKSSPDKYMKKKILYAQRKNKSEKKRMFYSRELCWICASQQNSNRGQNCQILYFAVVSFFVFYLNQ